MIVENRACHRERCVSEPSGAVAAGGPAGRYHRPMVRPRTTPRPAGTAASSCERGPQAGSTSTSSGFRHALTNLLPDEKPLVVTGTGAAADYAAALIESLGGRAQRAPGEGSPHPDLAWARSGAMALTGYTDGPPLLAPGPLAACADGAARALALLASKHWAGPPARISRVDASTRETQGLAPAGNSRENQRDGDSKVDTPAGGSLLEQLDGAALLGEHAAAFGHRRRGTTSAGETCRLLPAADGWIAVNLARPDDVALLPAWLGGRAPEDVWGFVAERVSARPAEEVVARARLLGLPAAVAVDPPPQAPAWLRVAACGSRSPRRPGTAPLVVDLSSLWAGPLCTHLLALAGARVIKVESSHRPDGARRGPAAFFDLMNAGKASVALDFRSDAGRAQLRRLVTSADIVVESARPRALAQLGIDAAALVAQQPGLTWVSITGYGRSEPNAGWVAFGDDAAVAGGLAAATGPVGGPPIFCGDAIADPLTGLHAAVAALASWIGGGAHLLDLALRDVAGHALGFPAPTATATVDEVAGEWRVEVAGERACVATPRARAPAGAARPLGVDTAAVLAELGIPC